MKNKKGTKEVMGEIKSKMEGHLKVNKKRIKVVGKDLDKLISDRQRRKNNGN